MRFENDSEAYTVISENFVIPRGFIIAPRVSGYKPNELEGAALDYLCDEWDYGYLPTTVEEREAQ